MAQQKCSLWLLHSLAGDLRNNPCASLGNTPNFPHHCVIGGLGSHLNILPLSKTEGKTHLLTTPSRTVCCLVALSLGIPLFSGKSRFFCILSATWWPLSPSLILSFLVLLLCAATCRVMCHFKHCRQWISWFFAATQCCGASAHCRELGVTQLHMGLGFSKEFRLWTWQAVKAIQFLKHTPLIKLPGVRPYSQVFNCEEHRGSLCELIIYFFF